MAYEVIGNGVYEYNLRENLGQGAFATVFKGRVRKQAHITVAVKVIQKKRTSPDKNNETFLKKEINIFRELSQLRHENLVTLHDCYDSPKQIYLVMEYCNGGDLNDYIMKHTKKSDNPARRVVLSEATIYLFLVQIARALRAMYSKGIVHRDLKPQNILLSYDPRLRRVQPKDLKLKLADFGFARVLSAGTMANTLCGSPMYMAPEVILNDKYDAKADLWSVATIVYQCLTTIAPYPASNPQELRNLYRVSPMNLAIPQGISAELADLLRKMLQRKPAERISHEEFFKHPFLQARREAASSPVGIPSDPRAGAGAMGGASASSGRLGSNSSLSSATSSPHTPQHTQCVSTSPLSGRLPTNTPHTHHTHHHHRATHHSPSPSGGATSRIPHPHYGATAPNMTPPAYQRYSRTTRRSSVPVNSPTHDVPGVTRPKSYASRLGGSPPTEMVDNFVMVPSDLPDIQMNKDGTASRRSSLTSASVDVVELFGDLPQNQREFEESERKRRIKAEQTARLHKQHQAAAAAAISVARHGGAAVAGSGRQSPHYQQYHHAVAAAAVTRGRPSTLPVNHATPRSRRNSSASPSEPVPVPGQVEAYEQMQRSLSQSSINRSATMNSPKVETSSDHMDCATAGPITVSGGAAGSVGDRSASCTSLVRRSSTGSNASLASISPPTVQFTIGTPPKAGMSLNHHQHGSQWRRHSNPAVHYHHQQQQQQGTPAPAGGVGLAGGLAMAGGAGVYNANVLRAGANANLSPTSSNNVVAQLASSPRSHRNVFGSSTPPRVNTNIKLPPSSLATIVGSPTHTNPSTAEEEKENIGVGAPPQAGATAGGFVFHTPSDNSPGDHPLRAAFAGASNNNSPASELCENNNPFDINTGAALNLNENIIGREQLLQAAGFYDTNLTGPSSTSPTQLKNKTTFYPDHTAAPYNRRQSGANNANSPANSPPQGAAATAQPTGPLGLYPPSTDFMSPTDIVGPISFDAPAPQLSEDNLLSEEHKENLSRLNYVIGLAENICELASKRSSPLSESAVDASRPSFTIGHQVQSVFVSESTRRLEQLVLYVRALELLSAGLQHAKCEASDGNLQNTVHVKTILKEMNSLYRQCLSYCKKLHSAGAIRVEDITPQKAATTADRLIYNHAIEVCQQAVLSEMFSRPEEGFDYYIQAQILLHSLTTRTDNDKDRSIIEKYLMSVNRRLEVIKMQLSTVHES